MAMLAKYTCPKCRNKGERLACDLKQHCRIDTYFNCPKCNVSIELQYTLQYTVSGPIVKVLLIKEYNLEIPHGSKRRKSSDKNNKSGKSNKRNN